VEQAPDELERLEAYHQADAGPRRELFDALISALKTLAAKDKSAAELWALRAVSPDLDYSSLMKLRRFAAPRKSENALRVAVLGGPTTTQLAQLLELFVAAEGIDARLYEGHYGLFRQEILAPDSELDAFKPQIVVLAVDARDVAYRGGGAEGAAAARDAEAARWASLWETAHRRWNCTVIQNTFVPGPWGGLGHYAAKQPGSREFFLRELNLDLGRRAPSYALLHSMEDLVAAAGAARWFDPRFYFEAKMPCAPECLVEYAHSLMSLVRAAAGRSRKVLALDLDNTLWGGVVGELGAGGIALGQGSGEGEAFLHFQAFAKSLRERGVVLAVCSKNDPDKASEPFELRSDMILKRGDFACFVANWNNKADNLRAIAKTLNLGLDSFVFVDDNPAERALVRRLLPEVAVPDLPEDPSGYVAAVARGRYFETAALTDEDLRRADAYAADGRRRDLAAAAGDVDSFLASLDMRAPVEAVSDVNLERVAQLVNKSNQFNLTTRRRTAGELRALAADPAWETLAIGLRDSLGDNGLISVILAEKKGDALVLDTWLMSCRVLQRGVEQFALGELAARARARGCSRLLGTYIPTPKNGLVKDHYAGLGFRRTGTDGDASLWELALDGSFRAPPTHVRKEDGHG
jgi:FkbH-like protein